MAEGGAELKTGGPVSNQVFHTNAESNLMSIDEFSDLSAQPYVGIRSLH